MATIEPIYVFSTDLPGNLKSETAAFAARAHGAAGGQASRAGGNAYAILYRSSAGTLLGVDVIKDYVESFFSHAHDNAQARFQIARFGCESGVHNDEVMAHLFSNVPKNCLLSGLWRRVLDPKRPVRLLVFDPAGRMREEAW